jgi:sarcosine oxidase subunit gamma
MDERVSAANGTSPLHHLVRELAAGSVPGAEGVQIAEVPLLAQVSLRGDPDDPRLPGAVRSALDLELAVLPNTFTRLGSMRCYWLGPDEWLVVAEPGLQTDLAHRLGARLHGQHASALDVSASRTTIELRGRRSREVLAKACSLDLHPRVFGPGRCAQTNVARTQALLALEDELPVFRLFVRSSFAVYLAQWLLDDVREYHPRRA